MKTKPWQKTAQRTESHKVIIFAGLATAKPKWRSELQNDFHGRRSRMNSSWAKTRGTWFWQQVHMGEVWNEDNGKRRWPTMILWQSSAKMHVRLVIVYRPSQMYSYNLVLRVCKGFRVGTITLLPCFRLVYGCWKRLAVRGKNSKYGLSTVKEGTFCTKRGEKYL